MDRAYVRVLKTITHILASTVAIVVVVTRR